MTFLWQLKLYFYWSAHEKTNIDINIFKMKCIEEQVEYNLFDDSTHNWPVCVVRHHGSGGAGEGEEASGDGEVPESSIWGDRCPLRVQGNKYKLLKEQTIRV